MPDVNGNPIPGDPGYVPSSGQVTNSGLMNTTQAPSSSPTAPAVAPYTPINQPGSAVTAPTTVPTDKTVSGGIEKIIAQGSPLMQQAEARAMQKMNERGLLNSSQAITAGQSAVIDAAMPIATADASQATQMVLADKQAATTKYTADLSSNTQLQAQSVDNAFKSAFQSADTQAKMQLQTAHDAALKEIADVEANYKTLMQTSASASDVFKAMMAGISSIYADTSIDAGAKASIINGQLGWARQQMNLIGSVNGVDLNGLTNFGTVSP